MYTQIKKQPSLMGIAANAVATAQIPTSGSHYALFLECFDSAGTTATTVANMKAQIGSIVFRIDGTAIWDVTATFLLALQKYYGDAMVAGNVNGYIPIYFAPISFQNWVERSVFAIGTNNVGVMTLEVTCAATITNFGVGNVYSEVSTEVRNVGQHIRVKKFPQSFASTGIQEISSLPRENAAVGYRALHIEMPGTAVISEATVKLGGNAIFDQVKAAFNGVLLAKNYRIAQTGFYHIDFGMNNDLNAFLPMAGVQDFRQILTWITAAPSAFNVYAEQIWGLNVTTSATK